MKNYYYILGIPSNAAEQEIRAAYKKLSVKFHPDNNKGDAFFMEHFKEIQEAFDTLAQPQKRLAYDQVFLSPKERAATDNTRPIIQQFEVSKMAISEGELITVSWEVVHADSVEINAIGKVAAKGTKTLRLGQLHAHAQMGLVIRARNSYIQQNTEKTIWIKNKTFVEQPLPLPQPPPNRKKVEEREENPHRFIERNEEESDTPSAYRQHLNKEKTVKKEPKNDFYVYFIVIIILLLTAVMAYIVFQMNGL